MAATELNPDKAARLAIVVKALADPTRLRIVDALRVATPDAVGQSQLLPLFDMSQPAPTKHLKVLVEAGVVRAERIGVRTDYELVADATDGLIAWLTR